MARVYLMGSTLSIAYTNDHSVGAGCANHRDDVLLVQFFLKVVSESPRKKEFTPPGHAPLIVDGAWGGASQAYLDHFLRAIPGLKRDGRVDPVVGGKLGGSISHTTYTILAMNAAYAGARGAAAHSDITTDSLFPRGLRPFIKIG